MRRAVQMTMFYVRNFGSVLQTYALQAAIEKVPGWHCETLNVRPWNDNGIRRFTSAPQSEIQVKRSFLKRLISVIKAGGVSYLLKKRKQEKIHREFDIPRSRIFEDFLTKEIRLTPYYKDENALLKNPPVADLYITGSDQTLNPRFTGGDPNWFFSFLPQKELCKRISYAASVAATDLDDRLKGVYQHYLLGYKALSFRELTGCEIAWNMGLNASHCCDPTLLLTREEWCCFASKSRRSPSHPYILSYTLRYMVDPAPMDKAVERNLQKVYGLPIIHIDEIADITPYEFVDLFMNATFIVTSSFHGTAFALQSGKPFISFILADKLLDSRAADLLRRCKAEHHLVPIGIWQDLESFSVYESSIEEKEALKEFREKSLSWLHNHLVHAV